MACQIADNKPLTTLRYDLGLGPQCHSLRDDCIHHFEKPKGNFVMGAPGAVIGYCQALFRKQSNPALHTRFVTEELKKINAPWALSHELFWSHRTNEEPIEFFNMGFSPLIGEGRVPILISSLDPAKNYEEIMSIILTEPAVSPGETVLLRLALSGEESVERISSLMSQILNESFKKKEMPKWWFLLQGKLSANEWELLKDKMGGYWKYVNIAVNPFITSNIPDFCWEQVTVAQVVVGHGSGITDEGIIKLAKGMKIQGASEEDSYDVKKYVEDLSKLEIVPTLIVLGPALSEWSDEENRERISKLIPHLKYLCDQLWDFISIERKESVWALKA